jgi:hypothetical protein
MNQAPAFDATIPVLTEVFQDEPARAELPPAEQAPAPAEGPQAFAGLAGDDAAAELGQRLSERILAQLDDRIGAVLEQHLRASIDAAIRSALAGAAAELRDSVRHIVAEAVAEQLAQVQALDH